MNAELFFIYDTHCPWSYATTALVNQVAQRCKNVKITTFHSAYFDGEQKGSKAQITSVEQDSHLTLSKDYKANIERFRDSTMTANLMAWVQNKQNNKALPLLNALQHAHFEQGNALEDAQSLKEICAELKLSPPEKVFKLDKLTKEAEFVLGDINELQQIIGTNAIPALLLVVNDNLILLNHNLYLNEPEKIIEAIELEL